MIEKIIKTEENLVEFSFWKKIIPRILLISLFIRWHVLIEDLPGVWKTTLSKAFSKLLWLNFSRIQWTSDILPQDIIWWEIVNFKTKEFEIKKWPIFNNVILIDEINRMHPKSQSAFLQAMEESQVSISWNNFDLPRPFFVLATQNPIEYSWTFSLPEAQRDRFSCQISIWFPDKKTQRSMLLNNENFNLNEKIRKIESTLTKEEILEVQREIIDVEISEEVLDRVINFAEFTRDKELFVYGLSPRALSVFTLALKANAYIEWRKFVIPEDWIELAIPFFAHRISSLDHGMDSDSVKEFLFENYKKCFVWL